MSCRSSIYNNHENKKNNTDLRARLYQLSRHLDMPSFDLFKGSTSVVITSFSDIDGNMSACGWMHIGSTFERFLLDSIHSWKSMINKRMSFHYVATKVIVTVALIEISLCMRVSQILASLPFHESLLRTWSFFGISIKKACLVQHNKRADLRRTLPRKQFSVCN